MTAFPLPPLQTAFDAYDRGDFVAAERICVAHARSKPTAAAWQLLGRLRTNQAMWAQATECFDKAQQLAPREPEVHIGRGMMAMRQGNLAAAVQAFERAQALVPGHQNARLNRAECLRLLGDARAALDAIGHDRGSFACLTAGRCLIDTDDLPGALAMFRLGLAAADRTPLSDFHLHAELGRRLEALGEHDAAFAEYVASKRSVPSRFEAEKFLANMRTLRETFAPATVAALAAPTVRTSRPIFIIGAPRSGTTLLEKMIASHAEGAGAGETPALRRQTRAWNDPADPAKRWPGIVPSLRTEQFDVLVRTYLEMTERFAPPGVKRVADKNLENTVLVGLIAVAFPEAAMIRIERDPIDTGISCFERLHANAIPWCADFEHIGLVLGTIDRMADHWRETFPDRILDVRYEDLVQDSRRQMERILSFVKLPWDEACLSPNERLPKGAEPPPTMSNEQIKRPLNDSSIGRGARFGALLDPLRAAYDRARAGNVRGADE